MTGRYSKPMSTRKATLSADKPATDPSQDLFGHAPFAKTLATAIGNYKSSDGIVLALYGPWGSGKSTVLGFVEHELEQMEAASRPVVVTFNPWWFSGQENLARAFLGQLQAVLPAKYPGFKKLGDMLSEFSGAIGTVADIIGAKLGAPGAGKVLSSLFGSFKPKPKDVPALKKSISELLLKEKKRVLVIIDDIDRLNPDEVRQLFTVIKALADFPYVTYLLAFDREVAASAIEQQTGLPGERFLEKIVQVPFELPMVDRSTLRQALSVKLDLVLVGTPPSRFDSAHWQNIYYSGLDPLFTVPRDVVRLTNALSVTYPSVIGEVSSVDFIAIECLRVFLPSVYDTIRSSPDRFTGYKAPENHEKQQVQAFHNAWLNQVPEHLRGTTKDLMERLFPRLESVWSNMHYGNDSLLAWRKELRVCAGGDAFSAYFRLSLPTNAVSQADLEAAFAAASDPEQFGRLLRNSSAKKLSSGVSKARGLLERLLDHLPELKAHAAPVLTALFQVGDELLLPTDSLPGTFDFGNEGRVTRLSYFLLKELPTEKRLQVIMQALQGAKAVRCIEFLASTLDDEAKKAASGGGESVLTTAETDSLKPIWRSLVEEAAKSPSFIDHPDLGALLNGWSDWGGEAQAKAYAVQAIQTDTGLVKLVASFASEATTQAFGDHAMKVSWRVKPASLQPYIDLDACAARLDALSKAGIEPAKNAAAVKDFLRRWKRMKAGKPETDFDMEDEE